MCEFIMASMIAGIISLVFVQICLPVFNDLTRAAAAIDYSDIPVLQERNFRNETDTNAEILNETALIATPVAILAANGWLERYSYRITVSPWVLLHIM